MEKNIEEAKKWLRRAVEAGSKEAKEKLKLIELQYGYNSERFGLVKVGSIIKFGSYPQNTKDKKEPIEWCVLAVEDGKALLISQYALDCKKYDDVNESTSWEQCTLRKWLNNDFMKYAFNSVEQKQILLSKVTADKNPRCLTEQGNDTEDNVFLLSVKEVKQYFKSDQDRGCIPTKFAVNNGVSQSEQNNGQCCWWLRSLGIGSRNATGVDTDGSVYYFGSYVKLIDIAVRPALWINLKS